MHYECVVADSGSLLIVANIDYGLSHGYDTKIFPNNCVKIFENILQMCVVLTLVVIGNSFVVSGVNIQQ